MVNVCHFSLSSAVCLAISRLHIRYAKYGGFLSMMGMKGEGVRVAAIDFSCSVTEMVSLVGRDIVKYASWSGIHVVLTALLARVDLVGLLRRAA